MILSVITRTCQRPRMLAQNMLSVMIQTDDSREHILIVDSQRVGIAKANKLFVKAIPHISGEYIYILDDDTLIIEPSFVQRLRRFVRQTNYPDVVMVHSLRPQLAPKTLPNSNVWGKRDKLRVATTNSLCYVVKAVLWKEKIAYYGSRVAGDWNFLNSLRKHRFEWLDLVVAKTQQLGRGRLFETGRRKKWFKKLVVEYGLVQLSDDVWKVSTHMPKPKKRPFKPVKRIIKPPKMKPSEPIVSGAKRGPDKGHALFDRRGG